MTRLVSLAVVLAWAAAVAAETGSHAPVAASSGAPMTQDQIDQRFKEAKASDIVGQLNKFKNGRAFSDPKIRKKLQSPEAVQFLRKLVNNDPAAMSLAEMVARSYPELRNLSQEELRSFLRQGAQRLQPGAAFDPPSSRPALPESAPNVPSLDERELAARQAYAERIGDLLKSWKLERLEGTLQDSPTFHHMLRELSRNVPADGAFPTTTLPNNFATNLQKLEGLVGDLRRWLPKKLPQLENIELPRGPRPSAASFSLGTSGLPGGFNLPTSGTVLLAVVAVGLAAVAAWRWFGRPLRASDAALVAAELEAVDPDTVSSREQLIRAVEHLTLLRFGRDARHWHHRRIERRLAAVAEKSDAEALTRIYELARYAPHADTDWSAARPLLRRLAPGA